MPGTAMTIANIALQGITTGQTWSLFLENPLNPNPSGGGATNDAWRPNIYISSTGWALAAVQVGSIRYDLPSPLLGNSTFDLTTVTTAGFQDALKAGTADLTVYWAPAVHLIGCSIGDCGTGYGSPAGWTPYQTGYWKRDQNYDVTTTASITTTVNITFSDVPEPATYLMLGGGLLALGLFGRRLRRR